MKYSRILFNKSSTGLVGLSVHPQPIPALETLYSRTLLALSRLPSTFVYKQSTELLTKSRLEIIQKHSHSVSEIEQKINCGQIEQLIIQAQQELDLVNLMQEWKPWEKLQDPPLPGQWKAVGTD